MIDNNEKNDNLIKDFFHCLDKALNAIKIEYNLIKNEYKIENYNVDYIEDYLSVVLNVIKNESFIININLFNVMLKKIKAEFNENHYIHKTILRVIFKKTSENCYLNNKFLFYFFDHLLYPAVIINDNDVKFEFNFLFELFTEYDEKFIYLLDYVLLQLKCKSKCSTNCKVNQIIDNFTTDLFIKMINKINLTSMQRLLYFRQFSYEEICEIISKCGPCHFNEMYYNLIIDTNESLNDEQLNSLQTIFRLNHNG